MSKFGSYLIASDLDGTFFGAKSSLLDVNIKAIKYFSDNGGIFTISTGRDECVLKMVLPNATEFINCPAILANGAYLYDFHNRKKIGEVGLDQEELLSVLDPIQKQFPEIGYRISSDRGFLCPYMPDSFAKRTEPFMSIVDTKPLSRHRDILWHKCVFVGDPSIIIELTKYLKAIPFQASRVTTSSTTLVEIIPNNAGKESRIDHLKSLYPERKIICVGDNDNDLGMLRSCDIAACPENAIDDVKAVSKIHLCHHRDGCIADLIYKLDSSIKE